jgi:hypothetical protein
MLAFQNLNAPRFACDIADVGRWHIANSAGQAAQVARADGKEQLEIFAAVQGEGERVERATTADVRNRRIDGQSRGFQKRARAALATEMSEVGREAVAEVYHRGRQLFRAEQSAPADTRLWPQLTDEQLLHA